MESPRNRSVLWLAFLAVTGAAGFFGGKWAREGLLPSPRTATRSVPTPPAAREPRVEPSSAEGKWMDRVRKAEAEDFAALLDDLDTTFPKGVNFEARDAAQKWLLGLWIARDPDAAAEYVAAKKDDLLGCSFGLVLGSVAPGKVEAVINGPLGNSFGKYFDSAVMRSLSATDPREYLRQADKPDAKSPPRYWARALDALAATDPQAAVTEWSRWGTKGGGKEALPSLLGVWVQQDASAARKWVESLENPETRRLAQHAWLGALARQDLDTARRTLAEMGWLVGDEKQDMSADPRGAIAAATARQDLPAALADLAAVDALIQKSHEMTEFLNGQPGSLDPRTTMRRAIVEAAAASLPDEPAALYAALDNLRTGNGAAWDAAMENDLILRKMRNKDAATMLEAARIGAERLQAAGETNLWTHDWLPNLVSDAARSDPAATVEFLSTLPAELRSVFAGTAFSTLEKADPAVLARAATFVPAHAWTSQMGQQFARAPQQTASAVAVLPVSPQTGMARHAFAEAWTRNDPDAAAQWIATLPPDAGTTEAARGVAAAWAGYDDTAASAWVASLPQGHARDGAALGLAATIGATEPEAAWHWADSISDATRSSDAFWNVARQWGNEAPPEFRAAFSAALDAAGYGGDIKAKALSDLDKPPQRTQSPP
jgi:hypothetical protein